MRIIEVAKEDRLGYKDLLLLGDEEMSMVERYLRRGTMFALFDDDLRAEAVVTEEGDGDYEIKNIAVRIGYQGMGYGSAMISFIKEYCRNRNGRTLYVGTGENPDTLRFYESNGFTRSHVIRDFFTDNYPHPIYEKGILLKDMIYLKQDLQQQQADRLS